MLRPLSSPLKTCIKVLFLAIILISLWGCAFVPQIKREYLSDPAMQPVPDQLEQELDEHRFQNQEGSGGGGSGAGGGCGC